MRVIVTARGYIGGLIVEPGEEIEVSEEAFSSLWMRKPSEPVSPGSQEGLKLKREEEAKKAAAPKTLQEALVAATPVPLPANATVELYKGGAK